MAVNGYQGWIVRWIECGYVDVNLRVPFVFITSNIEIQ